MQVPNRVLNPGQYTLPLSFTVSRKLPSLFVGTHGHIIYEIEARISTGRLHFDKIVAANIQVIDNININLRTASCETRSVRE